MIEKLSKIDYLNVIENNQILESDLWRSSIRVKNSDYQTFGLNTESIVKSALSNEIAINLVKHITNKLFESADDLENYDVEISNSSIDAYGDVKYSHKIRNDFYNKIFEHLLKFDGEFKFLITNSNLASIFMDFIDFKVEPPVVVNRNINGFPYKLGSIYNIYLFVDPYMPFTDNRILFCNRKINVESNTNLDFQGLEKIFKTEEKDIKNRIDHSDIDPFGEENWRTKREDFYVSATYKFKFSFDKKNFQKIKIIDESGLLI